MTDSTSIASRLTFTDWPVTSYDPDAPVQIGRLTRESVLILACEMERLADQARADGNWNRTIDARIAAHDLKGAYDRLVKLFPAVAA